MICRPLKLHFTAHGRGPTILVLHGFAIPSATWNEVIPLCTRDYTLLVCDLVGHGLSPSPQDGRFYRMTAIIDSIRDVLRRTNAIPLVVCGLSTGGHIAIRLALEDPPPFGGVIAMNIGTGCDDPRKWKRKIERKADLIESCGTRQFASSVLSHPRFAPYVTSHKSARVTLQRTIENNSPVGLANFARHTVAERESVTDLIGQIRSLRIPTLIVGGEREPFCRDTMKKVACVAPNASYVEIPRAGHLLPLESPKQTARVIRTFAASLRNFASLDAAS